MNDIILFNNRGIVTKMGIKMTDINKKTREIGTTIARGLIEEEIYQSDPIYAKIDQWFIEGVSEEKIKERVRAYMEKKEHSDKNS
jgi:hypothetical protein